MLGHAERLQEREPYQFLDIDIGATPQPPQGERHFHLPNNPRLQRQLLGSRALQQRSNLYVEAMLVDPRAASVSILSILP